MLDGELLSGDISNNTTAVAQTELGTVPVTIKTVAFVNTTRCSAAAELTLSIERPSYNIELLEGATLFGDEVEHESGSVNPESEMVAL